MRKRLLLGLALAGLLVSAPSSAQAAQGQRDPTFGQAGIAMQPARGTGGGASSVALEPDGKIVVGGWAWTAAGSDFELVRYEPNGLLDSTFGTGGVVTTNIADESGDNRISAMVIQPDGKIVVAGGNGYVILARYNEDGSPDRSFGSGGHLLTPLWGYADASLLVQPDGSILVAGAAVDPSGNSTFALARYMPDGLPDASFGHDGVVTTAFASGAVATSIVLQPDGKIVAGGYAYFEADYRYDFALARYNADGSLDTSFGTGGTVVTDIGNTFMVRLALQPDGKIVAGGSAGSPGMNFALARFLPDGALDPSFGNGGTVTTPVAGTANWINALALQPDGKIVAGGPGADKLDLARYNPDGSLDRSFGTGGVVSSTVWVGDVPLAVTFAGMALEPDGNILALANGPQCCLGGLASTFALMRYLGTPNCLVPTLRAKREEKAKGAVIRNGCSVGTVNHRFSRGVRKGRVMSQAPSPLLVLDPGSKVNFVVSKGPRRGPKGRVISQRLRAHTRHAAGTKVNLVVSTGGRTS